MTTSIPVGNSEVGIGIAPLGDSVYVTNHFDSSVSIISTGTNTVSETPIPVGANPTSVAFTPNGKFAYVTNSGGNTVSVINTTSLAVSTLTVGTNPAYVAIH